MSHQPGGPGSLRRHLLGWMALVMAAGTVLLAAATYWLTLAEMDDVFDEHLAQVAQAVALSMPAVPNPATSPAGPTNPASPGNPATPPTSAPAHAPAQTGDDPGDFDFHTAIHTRQGQLLFSSHAAVALPFSALPGLAQATLLGQRWSVHTVSTASHVVQVAQPALARQELAADAALALVGMLVALMALTALLLLWAVRRGLAPLDQAAASLAGRSATSLQPMAVQGLPAELQPLVAAINALLQRLALAFGQQRRFVADAAHALRTPVTALRLQLQLLQRARSPADQGAALAELRGGIGRAQRLIEQLLALSRAEPGGQVLRSAPVDLARLVQTVVQQRLTLADRFQISLVADVAADVAADSAPGKSGPSVVGDADALAVLLGNLVDNALVHVAAGSMVRVACRQLPAGPTLEVVDNGPGIAESERARVFDRFYRIPVVHNDALNDGQDDGPAAQADGLADGLQSGSGLGLAIVQTIAEQHGALVSLHTAPGGQGLLVRVVFLALPPGPPTQGQV